MSRTMFMPFSRGVSYNLTKASMGEQALELCNLGPMDEARHGTGLDYLLNLRRKLGVRITAALPGGLCFAGLAACTWGSFHVGQSFAFTGFIYLVLVVLAAMYGGFWQATLISIAAAACLNL